MTPLVTMDRREDRAFWDGAKKGFAAGFYLGMLFAFAIFVFSIITWRIF